MPIKLGGLGIRRATDLAPSAYLASIHASSDLVKAILPSSYVCLLPLLDDALGSWSAGHGSSPPVELTHKQKIWDHPRVIAASNSLLQNASSDVDKARLLAATSKESGVWLQALPVSSLGLRLDDDSLRVAVGLRLGTPLCVPHQCRHCGAEVDTTGHHALSCKWSAGRHHRHASLNDIIYRALSLAHVPARLEPVGLLRSDGKRPDGASLIPWKMGKPLVWDATCVDTYAPS